MSFPNVLHYFQKSSFSVVVRPSVRRRRRRRRRRPSVRPPVLSNKASHSQGIDKRTSQENLSVKKKQKNINLLRWSDGG